MEYTFLTDRIAKSLDKICTDKLYEIRFRCGFPVSINYEGKKFFLTENGISIYWNSAIICDQLLINSIIDNITEYSIYAFNERIKKGFLPLKNGVRVGVAGECVYDEKLITVKNINSLNVRIPHEVSGSSDCFFDNIINSGDFYNTLIISPPFCGKTTILKDVAKKINAFYNKNILIIDERGEFNNITGVNIDSIKYSDKLYAFDCGIRSMSPDIIITDELIGVDDWQCVFNAVNSGIKIISTCHAASIEEVLNKKFFKSGVFDRYIVLKKGRFGELSYIFDKNFNSI